MKHILILICSVFVFSCNSRKSSIESELFKFFDFNTVQSNSVIINYSSYEDSTKIFGKLTYKRTGRLIRVIYENSLGALEKYASTDSFLLQAIEDFSILGRHSTISCDSVLAMVEVDMKVNGELVSFNYCDTKWDGINALLNLIRQPNDSFPFLDSFAFNHHRSFNGLLNYTGDVWYNGGWAGSSKSNGVKWVYYLISENRFDLIKELLFVEAPTVNYLVYESLSLAIEKKLIQLDSQEQNRMQEIAQSKDKVLISSGCVRGRNLQEISALVSCRRCLGAGLRSYLAMAFDN